MDPRTTGRGCDRLSRREWSSGTRAIVGALACRLLAVPLSSLPPALTRLHLNCLLLSSTVGTQVLTVGSRLCLRGDTCLARELYDRRSSARVQ